jgi:hypothetical protein
MSRWKENASGRVLTVTASSLLDVSIVLEKKQANLITTAEKLP